MKDLSIEEKEKARLYDEAIKRAKEIQASYKELFGDEYSGEDIVEIFPELADDEDEKIKKWIRKELESKYVVDNIVNNEMADKAFAWLEKQGKQKSIRPVWKYKKDSTPLLRDSFILNKYGCVAKSPSGALVSNVWVLDFGELAKLPKEEFEKQGEQTPGDKPEPKFKIGDWVVQENVGVYKIVEICRSWYEVIDFEDERYSISFDYEYMCHLWTIQDAKDGDVLATEDWVFIFEKIKSNGKPACYCHYDIELGFRIDANSYIASGSEIYPATKEQHDLLFQKMKEAGYEWDVEKKGLKEIKSSSAWSKKDEERYVSCLQRLGTGNLEQPETINTVWLKSLKERMQLV